MLDYDLIERLLQKLDNTKDRALYKQLVETVFPDWSEKNIEQAANLYLAQNEWDPRLPLLDRAPLIETKEEFYKLVPLLFPKMSKIEQEKLLKDLELK